MGRRRKGSGSRPAISGGRLRLASVDALLEVAPDLLSAREDRVVAQATGWELDKANVFVAVAMAAGIGGGLVEGPQAVSLCLSPHCPGCLAEGRSERNPTALLRLAVCAENVGRQYAR